mmetsp:Transcript_56253/g.122437  ORF Transcript_56253/g.122437 Transcript_56253/m.122437 type:complete len:223 (+) Transcript_56253:138-806(+)
MDAGTSRATACCAASTSFSSPLRAMSASRHSTTSSCLSDSCMYTRESADSARHAPSLTQLVSTPPWCKASFSFAPALVSPSPSRLAIFAMSANQLAGGDVGQLEPTPPSRARWSGKSTACLAARKVSAFKAAKAPADFRDLWTSTAPTKLFTARAASLDAAVSSCKTCVSTEASWLLRQQYDCMSAPLDRFAKAAVSSSSSPCKICSRSLSRSLLASFSWVL